MDYKERVESLQIGMYSIVESTNSPVLEAFGKKQVNHNVNLASQGFRKYLKYVYADRSIGKEIKNAKTMDQKWELAKKYSADYEKYKKIQSAEKIANLAPIIGSLASLKLGVMLSPAITGILMFGPMFYAGLRQQIDRTSKQNGQYNDFLNRNNQEDVE
jgi:hypothetical protein